jgi:hypothetical protein
MIPLFIPPSLAILAAKHSKKLFIALAVGIVIAGVYFAVKMHERTVEKLAASEAARAAQVVAHEITIASLGVQTEAAARWKASAQKYQETLSDQVRMREEATSESRSLSEKLPSGRLERLARAKPVLLERAANRGTARIIGLLNCNSTSSGCDEDRGTTGPDASNSLSPATGSGNFRMDRDGAGTLARSGRSVFLPGTSRLRSSGT